MCTNRQRSTGNKKSLHKNKLDYIAAIIFAVSSLFNLARAQPVETAVISGRVSNAATGKYLVNAVVVVDGTNLKAQTAADGFFRISGVPVGDHVVIASFTGLDQMNLPTTVAANEEKSLDFQLTSAEVFVLGQYVVSAEREGSAFAVNEQRQASNIKQVVSADSFGNMVDGNIGELMKNLPGVTVDYSGEDASAIRIRGMDPAMATVTMDGNSLASGGGSTSRKFDLGIFAVQNIETIEVTKSPTPAQPANSMGGSVNFITKNAFSQKGRRIRVDGNISLNSAVLEFQKTPGGARTPDRKILPGFNLYYSEAFGKKHPLGVAINASVSRKYRFSDNYDVPNGYTYNSDQLLANAGWPTADMTGVVPRIKMTETGNLSERRFISANFDYKLSESTVLFLYNSFTNDEGLGGYTHIMDINVGQTQGATADLNTMATSASTAISPGMTSATGRTSTRTYNINPGVKHRFGDLEISYDGYISNSKYAPDMDQNFSVGYTAPAMFFKVDGVAGRGTALLTQTGGADYKRLSNYKNLSITQDYRPGEDEQLGGKIDGKYKTFLFRMPVEFQVGGRYNRQNRKVNPYYRILTLTGSSASSTVIADYDLGQFADQYFYNEWGFNGIPVADWVSPYLVYDYYLAHPNLFYDNILTKTQRERSNWKRSREDIYAGYAMSTVSITPELVMLAGVRYEYTALRARGVVYLNNEYSYVTDPIEQAILKHQFQVRKKSYDRTFPNLQFRYEPVKNLVFRTAYYTGIGRPDLGSLLPGDNVNETYKTIRRNNPKLMPQTSANYDFSAEYYLPSAGIITLAAFSQRINRYIYSDTYIDYLDGTAYAVTEPLNAASARNDGIELSYRQRLKFLPGLLKNIEVYASYSKANPRAKITRHTNAAKALLDATSPTSVEAYNNSPYETYIIPMFNVVRNTANIRLSYQDKRFTASISGNWRDKFLRSQGTYYDDIYQEADFRIDTSVSYRMNSKWTAYLDWRNVTNEPDSRTVFGRTSGYYKSGMVLNVGLRADL